MKERSGDWYNGDNLCKYSVVVLKVFGFCKTKWIIQGGKNESNKIYKSKEEYVSKQIAIWRGENNHSFQVEPGNHERPFSIAIPRNAPSSFSSKYGNVSYSLTVTCVCSGFSSNKELVRRFSVYDIVDLSRDPLSAELFFDPLRVSRRYEDSCCLCFCLSSVSTNITFDGKAYSPGDRIMLNGYIDNTSNTKYALFLTLSQQVTCYAKRTSSSRNFKTKVKTILLAQWKSLNVMKQTKKTFNNTPTITVPTVVATNLRNCRLIDVVYFLKVRLVSKDILGSDIGFGEYPITIGHKGQLLSTTPATAPLPADIPVLPTAPPLEADPIFVSYPPSIDPELHAPPPSYMEAIASSSPNPDDQIFTVTRT